MNCKHKHTVVLKKGTRARKGKRIFFRFLPLFLSSNDLLFPISTLIFCVVQKVLYGFPYLLIQPRFLFAQRKEMYWKEIGFFVETLGIVLGDFKNKQEPKHIQEVNSGAESSNGVDLVKLSLLLPSIISSLPCNVAPPVLTLDIATSFPVLLLVMRVTTSLLQ